MRYISGSKLDERVIRCDLDPGYREGRQFGRGKNGGQVRPSLACVRYRITDVRCVLSLALSWTSRLRSSLLLLASISILRLNSTVQLIKVRDEFRQEYDSGRGGWGHQRALLEQQAQDRAREELQYQVYAGVGGTGLGGGDVPLGEGAESGSLSPLFSPSSLSLSMPSLVVPLPLLTTNGLMYRNLTPSSSLPLPQSTKAAPSSASATRTQMSTAGGHETCVVPRHSPFSFLLMYRMTCAD